ncbi:MAG: hypothetical protein BWY76_01907 [bacterium ADurb.Bin429]|nr:MAG: hypothetical protein BWY76_01907 [bacterium ADurb.Bin429]
MRRCPTIEQLAAFQAGLVTAQERKHLDGHLVTCAQCQHELAALISTTHLLARLPAPSMPADLWPGVAQRLQQRRQWRGLWWRVTASAGIAATLLVGVITYRGNQTGPLPTAPAMTASYVRNHQLLSAQDPLTDRASLGVALASYRSTGE